MTVSLYQNHVINDIQSLFLSNNYLIGLVEDKKATLRRRYGVWDIIYNNLADLNSFDKQVPLVYTVLLKASSNEKFQTQLAGP